MIIIIFLLGLIIYTGYTLISYNEPLKETPWFIPAGVLISLFGNILWMYLAKITSDPKTLYFYGIAWDAMITFVFVLTPVIVLGMRFKTTTAIGFGLVVIGLLITKIGS